MALTVESESITHGERVPDEHAFGVPDGSGKAAGRGSGNRSPHLRCPRPGGHAVVCGGLRRSGSAGGLHRRQPGGAHGRRARPAGRLHALAAGRHPGRRHRAARGCRVGGDRRRCGKPTGETRTASPARAPTPRPSPATPTWAAPTAVTTDRFRPGTTSGCTTTTSPSTRSTSPASLSEFRLDDVRAAIEGHVLDQGELVATYTLHADKLPELGP